MRVNPTSETKTEFDNFKIKASGAFLVLFVICTIFPFVGQALPYGLPLFGPIVSFTFSLVILSKFQADAVRPIQVNIGVYGSIFVLVVASYLYGLMRTHYLIAVKGIVLQDLINGLEMMLLWITAVNISWDKKKLDRFCRMFIVSMLTICTLLAVIGLYKFFLLQKDIKLSFILNGVTNQPYPWGSSLVEDYNSYALTLLCGIMAALYHCVVVAGWRKKCISIVGLFVMILAGLLSGSRRFWILAPILIVFGFFILRKRNGLLYAMKLVSLIICIPAIGAIVASQFIKLSGGPFVGGLDISYRFETLLSNQDSYGFAARLDRINYAFSLLDKWTVLFGRGFDYIVDFGCRYGGCLVGDYPHNPILSAFLYGGFISAAVTILFIFCVVRATLKSLAGDYAHRFLGLCAIAVAGFNSIAANSVLSSKILLIVVILCMLCERYLQKSSNIEVNPNAHFTHCS